MNRSTPWLLGSIVLLAAGSLPMIGQAAQPTVQAISTADSRSEHEALAAGYEQEAKTLSATAEDHRKMAKAYGAAPYGAMPSLGPHCEDLAKYYEKAARANLELAKLHHQLAAQVSK